jgi:hypothetical protein
MNKPNEEIILNLKPRSSENASISFDRGDDLGTKRRSSSDRAVPRRYPFKLRISEGYLKILQKDSQ